MSYSYFAYADLRFVDGAPVELEIDIRPRIGSRAICAGCGRRGPGYDTLCPRRFQFVPLWGILVKGFEARGMISAGIVEGMNKKLKVTFRKAYGFKHVKTTEIALYHTPGRLPEPGFTHRFF